MSILETIKNLLGIHDDNKDFDDTLLIHINTIVSKLNQLGVGPDDGITIVSNTTWEEYETDIKIVNLIKSYMYLEVKMLFDPSASSVISESINRNVQEMKHRILEYTNLKYREEETSSE